jgi:hypothetical protein
VTGTVDFDSRGATLELTVIEWLLPSGQILTSVLGRSPDAPAVKPVLLREWIPYAARGWRRVGESKWRRLADLPPEWGLKGASGGAAIPKGDYLKDPEDGYADEDEG